METAPTKEQLGEDIAQWYGHMVTCRIDGDEIGEQIFEEKMNAALDQYGDVCKFAGRLAGEEHAEAA